MKEIKLAKRLNKYFETLLKSKGNYRAVYYFQEPEIEKCNFNILEKECLKLNFCISKMNNTKFDKKFLNSVWKQNKGIILYNNFTLSQIANKNSSNCPLYID